MLDYVQSLWCALQTGLQNRGTVITFANEIKVQVPFKVYSAVDWFSAIEVIRANSTICCSCCTPTAEAFAMAQNLLAKNQLSDGRSTVVFVITDGDPWQNSKKTPGTIWTYPKYSAAKYRYSIVPQQSELLKNTIPNSRIMLVGVPNAKGHPPALYVFH